MLLTYPFNMLSLFIKNRSFRVQIDTDTFKEHSIKAGVSQASVLDLTLFNIFYYDILPL